MTTAPPDDDFESKFENALAVFTHGVRVILPEPACQLLTERIQDIHDDCPELDFAEAAAAARGALAEDPGRPVDELMADIP